MKREEKNLQSRQKILQSALTEFAEKGYGGSSVNAICAEGGISKGVLYHYFQDKDQLYLACVGACFDALTAHLAGHAAPAEGDAESRLTAYFDARLAFFREHPRYQRLFFEAVLSPPDHLAGAIAARREAFDALNRAVFGSLLERVRLRPDLGREEVIDILRQYQDFVNATTLPGDIEGHEARARRAVNVLLFGVVARAEGGAER